MTQSSLQSTPFSEYLADASSVVSFDNDASTSIGVATNTNTNEGANVSDVVVDDLIGDLALILIIGAITTLIFKKLKQPVVLGYIVAGFLASPHFLLAPSVTNEENIEFWAQIGIVVLLFSLGLEFSFKKLLNVGGSAIVTALIIVTGMLCLGFFVGKLMNFSFINSLFLGSMLSMSSTTIIIKAFTDLNLRQRKFASLVFAVLICEDLFAVIMMVILSSVAINNTVEGSEMVYSVFKLVFFLVIWFSIGVFILPSFFRYFSRFINDELLLITSMGLCFSMAIFSVYSGFSLALGAFVMGSILAGTCEAEHISKVVKPVKDLFGGVFFISVGMMVNPHIIWEYMGPILLLSSVVIVGMIVFGTFGMLVTGQTLKIAIESGFSLTQIGEFAFIIATMGISLGVLDPTIYPMIVAVSVITTFFTPYFIRFSLPCYNWIEAHLPANMRFLINRYSKAAIESELHTLWKIVSGRYLWRILLYSSILIAIISISRLYFFPFMEGLIPSSTGTLIATIITLSAMAPFLLALSTPSTKKTERDKLLAISGSRSSVPLVVMSLLRIVLAFGFVIGFLSEVYTHAIGFTFGFSILVLLVVFLSKSVRKRMHIIESKFVNNLNERELRRSGKANNLVSDLHVAYMEVGYSCPFVGERLVNSNLRREYGVNVVSIQRGGQIYPIPSSDMRIFPGDLLGVIGNDEQINKILSVVEANVVEAEVSIDPNNIQFVHFEISVGSPLIGKTVADARIREDYTSMLVAVQHGENEYVKPTGSYEFQQADVLWIVGDIKKIEELKK
ncbi:MAG: cation:proton antiporter [Muribaculaceae bacterium]